MTRNTDFYHLFDYYIGSGAFIALLICLFGLLFGAVCFNGEQDKIEKVKNIYLALEGKDVENSKTQQAAALITYIVKKGKTFTPKKYAGILKEIDDFGYLDLFLKKRKEIIGLVQGKIKNLSNSVEIPQWMTFWKWFGALAWLCFAVGMTVNFVWTSVDSWQGSRRVESLIEWPWKSWWTYPVILIMSPALLPCMVVEATVRLFTGSLRRTLTGEELERQRHSQQTRQPPVLNKAKLAKQKAAARKQIQNVRKTVENTKEVWVQTYLANLEEEPERLQRDVDSKRQLLSTLGGEISSAQKALAESQKKLADWKKNEDKIKIKARAEHLKDFERLQNLAHVEAMEIDNDILHVYTDTIYIETGSSKHEIGNFVIKINMRAGCFHSLKNLCTTNPSGRDHPYGSGGSFCFGSLGSPIYRAFREREFAAGTQFILKALQSADGDNPRVVKNWKKVAK